MLEFRTLCTIYLEPHILTRGSHFGWRPKSVSLNIQLLLHSYKASTLIKRETPQSLPTAWFGFPALDPEKGHQNKIGLCLCDFSASLSPLPLCLSRPASSILYAVVVVLLLHY